MDRRHGRAALFSASMMILAFAQAMPAAGSLPRSDTTGTKAGAFDPPASADTQDDSLRGAGAWSFYNRGNAYLRNGDYERAILAYSRASQSNPNDADIFYNRALAFECLGDWVRAIADLGEAFRLDPESSEALVRRAFLYLSKGYFAAAIADYDAALKLQPRDMIALYGRGLAKLKRGETANGRADIAAAKARKPDIADVFAGYGSK